MTREMKREGLALLLMRFGIAWFIFLWAIHKIITPKQYQGLARHFDGVDLSFAQIYGVAALQIIICILVLIGAFRLFSYSAIMVMHLFTISRRWEKFIDPFALSDKGFPINRNVSIDIAVICAMIALILLMHRDHFSIGGWKKLQGRGRWWL